MTMEEVAAFQRLVLEYYKVQGRHDLPWRQPDAGGLFDPYRILVSEIMLQQTQVPRVLPKFEAFIRQFPSVSTLAAAPLAEVLKTWSGLGYNRRAKFLWQAAQAVANEHSGRLPKDRAALELLPGVGSNTAGAVLAYAYNQPVVFIETNIRTVFIHHFFAADRKVSDKKIADIVVRTLPDDPRTWYWALMDYGTHLKQTIGNLSRASAHYSKQSPFAGSRRQIRGQVLRLLGERPYTYDELSAVIADARLASVLNDLLREGFIQRSKTAYNLRES